MGILRFPWKSAPEPAQPVIGILAFEVAGLMSKMANLWHSLSDKEISWLREQIADSVGIRRFVSEDADHLMELALDEKLETFGCLSRSVARLSKKCKDPVYHCLEEFYKDPARHDLQWFGWSYKGKKMDRKVKKMERFVAASIQLSHEEEVLAELEQTLRRMNSNSRSDHVKLLEFQQKVMWQRQEVKTLRGMSPWWRTFDYIVRLMARSLFTILERMKIVFGVNRDFNQRRISDCLPHDHSSKRENFRRSKSKRHGGSFSGCVARGNENCKATVGGSMRLVPSYSTNRENPKKTGTESLSSSNIYSKLAQFGSKRKLLNFDASTLGHAGLALQYSNIIILIEKLSSSPHLISPDARDDLYNMLTTAIRTGLRAKLKSYAKSPGSNFYNPVLTAEWNMALVQILEWLAPLAHNTIRWHSERNIEKQNDFGGTNVLLVHTLYHANQAKVEVAITELLLGLNYVSRVAELNQVQTSGNMSYNRTSETL